MKQIRESRGAQKRPDIGLSLRETQLASLSILKRVDEICNKLQLRYWLAYGTLIGAVRHNGFIPWDDDIDICMPRPDYDALVKYFDSNRNELAPLLAIHNHEKRYLPFLITRISDTRYKMIGEHGGTVPEMGAFIDIYPLDGLGNDYQTARKIKEKCFEQMLFYVQAGNYPFYSIGANPIKKALKALNALRLGSPCKYAAAQHTILSSHRYEDSEYVSVAVWGRLSAMEVFHASCFEKSIPVHFEDMVTWAPCGYDEVLRGYYRDVWGEDYMTLPPRKEQKPHHTYKLIHRPEKQQAEIFGALFENGPAN